jgi:DNA-directed RNA polymerase subunit M/transcription elongation factor TFIIS
MSLKAYADTLSPSLRGKVVMNLRAALLSGVTGTPQEMLKSETPEAIGKMACDCAKAVEEAMKAAFPNFCKEYVAKARQLTFNAKKNGDLAANVLVGFVEAKELVAMTPDQLATKEKLAALESKKKLIDDARRLDWETENEDKINEQAGITGDLLQASLFTCGRCKSIKTTSTQKQTRSADEPMTVFVHCKVSVCLSIYLSGGGGRGFRGLTPAVPLSRAKTLRTAATGGSARLLESEGNITNFV